MLTRVFIACMIAASLVSAQPGPMMGGAGPMGGIGGSPMGGMDGSPVMGGANPMGGVGEPMSGPTPFSTLAALVSGTTTGAASNNGQQLAGSLTGFLPQAGATGLSAPSMMAPSATAAPSFSASSAAPFATSAAPTMPLGQLDSQAVFPTMTGMPAQSVFPTMSGMPAAQTMPTMSGMPALGVNTQASMTGGAQLPNLQNAFNTAAAPIGSTPLNGFSAPSATGSTVPTMPSTMTGMPTFSSALPVANTNSIVPSATGLPMFNGNTGVPAANGAIPAANGALPAVTNAALPVGSNNALPVVTNNAVPSTSSPLGALPGTSSTTAGALPISSSLPTLPASTSLPVMSNGALSMPAVSQAPAGSTVQPLNGAQPTVVSVPALTPLV